MAEEQYRATVSAVFWATSAEEAQGEIDALKAALPGDDAEAVLGTIEYVADGRPSTEAPPQENPPDASGPPDEPEAE